MSLLRAAHARGILCGRDGAGHCTLGVELGRACWPIGCMARRERAVHEGKEAGSSDPRIGVVTITVTVPGLGSEPVREIASMKTLTAKFRLACLDGICWSTPSLLRYRRAPRNSPREP